VHVSREWPLEQLAEAHRAIEQGHTVGKIAVRVRQD
jgi:Zinc-binding dehydrogenase